MPNDNRDKRLPLPFRSYVGVFLAAAVVAIATLFANLGAIGAPKADDFHFSRGVSFAPGEENRLKGYISAIAADDRIVIRITGHTGTKGDAAANTDLSDKRAMVTENIILDMGIASGRIQWAGGIGSGNPLPRDQDVNERTWERTLARVTIDTKVAP